MRRSRSEIEAFDDELNLVPFMDVLVTLVSFFLVTMMVAQFDSVRFQIPKEVRDLATNAEESERRGAGKDILNEAPTKASFAFTVDGDSVKIISFDEAKPESKKVEALLQISNREMLRAGIFTIASRYQNIERNLLRAAPGTNTQRVIDVMEAIQMAMPKNPLMVVPFPETSL